MSKQQNDSSVFNTNLSDIFNYQITELEKNNKDRKDEIKDIKKDIFSILNMISKTNSNLRSIKNDISELKQTYKGKETKYIDEKLTAIENKACNSSSDGSNCNALEETINEYINLQISYQLNIHLENINNQFENIENTLKLFTKKIVASSRQKDCANNNPCC